MARGTVQQVGTGKSRRDATSSDQGRRERPREVLGDLEQAYLARARDTRTRHRFVLLNGAQHEGTVLRFDRYVVEVARVDRPPVVIRKLALAYYYATSEEIA